MLEVNLVKSLESSQELFLRELKANNSSRYYLEIETIKELENFCWAMAFKYAYKEIIEDQEKLHQFKNKNDEIQYLSRIYRNHLIGKSGEMAVKKNLDDLISDVDFNIRRDGDQGYDFKLSDNTEVKIQVKTRQGELDKTIWSVSQQELYSNAIIICVHAKDNLEKPCNTIQINNSNYQFMIAGFLPSYKVIEISIDDKIQTSRQRDGSLIFNLGIENLLHYSGIKNYLELISNEIWKEIECRSGQAYQIRFDKLSSRLIPSYKPENELLEFNMLLKQALNYFREEDFGRSIDTCSNALVKYENFYVKIDNFFSSDLNFTSNNQILEKFGIREINFPSKKLFHTYDYRLALQVYQLRGTARLKQRDFEGAQSDFLIFILLSETPIRNKPFSLSKQISSFGNIDGYALASTNVLAFYNRGYSLFHLQRYDWALNIFNEIIEFLTDKEKKDEFNLLATSYKYKGDIFKIRKRLEEALIFYNQAIEIDPTLAESILSESKGEFNLKKQIYIEIT